jgi:hypothetical protein
VCSRARCSDCGGAIGRGTARQAARQTVGQQVSSAEWCHTARSGGSGVVLRVFWRCSSFSPARLRACGSGTRGGRGGTRRSDSPQRRRPHILMMAAVERGLRYLRLFPLLGSCARIAGGAGLGIIAQVLTNCGDVRGKLGSDTRTARANHPRRPVSARQSVSPTSCLPEGMGELTLFPRISHRSLLCLTATLLPWFATCHLGRPSSHQLFTDSQVQPTRRRRHPNRWGPDLGTAACRANLVSEQNRRMARWLYIRKK